MKEELPLAVTVKALIVKERILLHLFDYARYAEEYVAPLEVTQEGIARATGIRVHHVTQYVKPLIAEELVEENTRHVTRKARHRKVYFLSAKGRHRVASLRNSLLKEIVPFRLKSGEIQEVPFSDIFQEQRRGSTIIDLLQEHRSVGYVSEVAEAAEAAVVDFTQEAPRVEGFYGRERELEEVLVGLNQFPSVVVSGMAGIGKTTLGSKVCDSLRGQRSLFWRQIRPWDTAMDLALRLATFLKSLGRIGLCGYLTTSGTKELSRIEELLTTDLAGLDLLLVLDDVHNASEDATAFLAILHRVSKPHEGTAVLLLSRHVPDFYSRREVAVDQSILEVPLKSLDLDSSQSLLVDAGINEPLLGLLASAGGGNPLFLRLLASAGPDVRPEKSLSTLETYITEEIEPSLRKGERGCLEAASLYQVPVPAEGLLLVPGARRKTLISLRRKGLLDHVDPDRFVLHDSLRSYFRRGIPPERLEALISQVVQWLREEALKIAEGGNPQEAIPYVGNAGEIDVDPKSVSENLQLLARFRRFSGDFSGAVEALRTALGKTTRPDESASIQAEISRCLVLRGDLDEAEEVVESALSQWPTSPSLETAWLLYYKALVAYQRQEFDKALKEIERVKGWIQSIPEDLHLSGSLANTWGLIHLEDPSRIDLSLAQESFQEALAAWQAVDDKIGLCLAYNNLALVANAKGEFEEAQQLLDDCAVLASEMGNLSLQLMALFSRAAILTVSLGDYDAAESLFRKTYTLAKDIHRRDLLVWHHYYYAEIHRHQDRLEEAMESLDYFLGASGDLLNEENRVVYLGLMVRICALSRNHTAAAAYLEEAENLAGQIPSQLASHALAWARGALQASRGETEKAEASFRQAHEIPVPVFWEEFLLDYGRFLASAGEGERAKEILLDARNRSATASRQLEREAQELLQSLGDAREG